MNALAHILMHDSRHLKGTDDDATLVPFEGKIYICGWKGITQHQVPDPVLFEANFKVTRQSDYPCNDVNWPLMSPHMIEVLRGVGEFSHRLIAVRFIDRAAMGPARYRPDGSLRPKVFDDRFAAVQLTEHIDAVDWENSVFEKEEIAPNIFVYSFDKLILQEPSGGFPPLFRVPAQKNMLLVSAEARRALEAAGIRGIRFMSLPGAPQVEVAP